MRILLIADIHANRAALDAIQEPFDACFCMGDLVEYGPDAAYCVDWVRKHVTAAVRGNHDHGCVQDVEVAANAGFRYLTMATRRPTFEQLSPDHRQFLSELPLTRMLTVDGFRFMLVHATPRDPLDEYTKSDPATWESRLAGVRADFVCVGHTHHQFAFKVGRMVVVNPGSVGLPRDGDPRARYAIIDNGRIELKQVEYPIEETIAGLAASNFPEKAQSVLSSFYRHGQYNNGKPAHGDADLP